MKLTEHFSLEELTFTQHREFDNVPPGEVVERLRTTAQGLERIRTLLGHPIHVNSGYRSTELNRAVGGATNSQHCAGLAVDFICPGFGSPLAVARFLSGRVINLGIDQLIHEFDSWVHVSFTDSPRHVLLSIDRSGTHLGIQ